MNVREVAEEIADMLLDENEERLLAVGWYSQEEEQRTGSVYMGEDFGEYTGETGSGTLESAMLESLGNPAHERIHDERLTTTVRFYETIADIDLHINELEGIVIAVREEGDFQIGDVVQLARAVVPGALSENSE